VIDRKVARRLGLVGRTGTVFNVGRSVPVEWVDVNAVEVGPLRVRQIPMLAADLGYSAALTAPVDIILGLDLLRTQNFSIDYRNKWIRIGGPTEPRFRVPMSNGPLFLSIELQLRRHSVRVLIDTGIGAMLLYQDRVGNEMREARTRAEVEGFTVGGRIRAREAITPPLKLGEVDLDRTVLLLNGPPPRTLPQIDGYWGINTLHAREIDFDFKNNTFGWK
jgi:hypothetical protein